MVMFGSTDAGIQTYDGYNFKNISGPDDDFSSFAGYKTYESDESDDGLIWLEVYGKGLYTFDKLTQTYELMLKTDEKNSISYFYHGDNKKVWITTLTTVGYLDLKTKAFIKEVDLQELLGIKNTIYHLYEKNNILYIATSNGIFAYHIETKQLLKLPSITPQNTTNEDYRVTEAAKAYVVMVIEQALFIGTNDGVFSLGIVNIEEFITRQQTLPNFELIIPHISVWQFYLHNNLLLVAANEGLYEFNLDIQSSNFQLSFDLF
jgi:ligand-binding sensor domain-containing protein